MTTGPLEATEPHERPASFDPATEASTHQIFQAASISASHSTAVTGPPALGGKALDASSLRDALEIRHARPSNRPPVPDQCRGYGHLVILPNPRVESAALQDATQRNTEHSPSAPSAERRTQAGPTAAGTGGVPANNDRQLNVYFLRDDGIDEEVIATEICRYLGNDASVRKGLYLDLASTGFRWDGYRITSYEPLTPAMLRELQAASAFRRRQLEASRQPHRMGAGIIITNRTKLAVDIHLSADGDRSAGASIRLPALTLQHSSVPVPEYGPEEPAFYRL